MTQQQVEILLGGPPGRYGRGAGPGWPTAEGEIIPLGATKKIWCDDDNKIEILFDNDERVIQIYQVAHHERPLWDRLIDLTGFKVR